MKDEQPVGLFENTATRDSSLSEQELCPDDLLAGQEAAYARDIKRLQRKKKNFVPVVCPACAENNAHKIFTKFGFSFLRCTFCQTIYMSPRPTEAILAAYYATSENYTYWAKHIFPTTEDARREKLHRPRLERIVDYCRRFSIPRDVLLEMGPGFGTFAHLAQTERLFQKVMVVEASPELATACQAKGLATHMCRIEDLPLSMEPVHCLVAFEVIEHLFAVAPVLQSAWQRLVSGGLLVLTCPNGLGFDIATLGAKCLSVDTQHVNFFNPFSLSLLVERCGFEVLEVTTPGKLDAEFVREAALKGQISLDRQPFLKRVLLEQWEELGQSFQQYLAAAGLSSHMWLVARKISQGNRA